MIEGIELAGKELKAAGLVSELTVENSANDVNLQLQQINAMITDGYDGIIINAISDESLGPVIEAAKAAGVQIFIANDPAAYEDTISITVDAKSIWTAHVQWFMEQMKGQGGDIVYLSGVAGNSTDNQRTEIVHEYLAKYPEINLLTSAPCNWDQAESQSVMSTLLSAYDPIDGLLAQDYIQEGILRAYENAGRPYPTVMNGDSSFGFLEKWATPECADINSVVVAYPSSVGYDSVYIAAYVLNGRTFKDGALEANSQDSSLINTIYVRSPYIVTPEKATGNEAWLDGLDMFQTQMLSLEEAIAVCQGKPSTYSMDNYWTLDIVESFFNPA
jgi:ribose transport system substrate-binding protein